MHIERREWQQALALGRWCCRYALNADHLLWASINRKSLLRDLAAIPSGSRFISNELWGAIAREWEQIKAPSADHVHGLLTLCRTWSVYSTPEIPTNLLQRACQMAQTLNVGTPYVSRVVLELARFAFEHEFLNAAEILSSFLWKTSRTPESPWRERRSSKEITDRAAELVMDIYRVRGQSWEETEIFPDSLRGVAQRGISDPWTISNHNDRSIPTGLLIIMWSRTPLQWAAENGWGRIVLRLLASGGETNAQPAAVGGRTAFRLRLVVGILVLLRNWLAQGPMSTRTHASIVGVRHCRQRLVAGMRVLSRCF